MLLNQKALNVLGVTDLKIDKTILENMKDVHQESQNKKFDIKKKNFHYASQL